MTTLVTLTEDEAKDAVAALSNDRGFISRVTAAAAKGTKKAVMKAVTDEVDVWKRGVSALNKFSRIQGASKEEIQALVALAAHSVVMTTLPGVGAISNFVVRFLTKRVASSAAWRVIDFLAKKAIGENLQEASGRGDCFEAAFEIMMHEIVMAGFNYSKVKSLLVHGEVAGQGPLMGIRYVHAWVEKGDTVLDYSNGRRLEMPKVAYYALGDVKDVPGKVYRYTAKQMQRWANKLKHYGPWELESESGL